MVGNSPRQPQRTMLHIPGVTTSLVIFGKSPNPEPQFPNLSNVALNRRIWKLLPHGIFCLWRTAIDKTFCQSALTFKYQKTSPKIWTLASLHKGRNGPGTLGSHSPGTEQQSSPFVRT